MMESPMTRNCHVGFGERYEETHQSQDWEMRFVPTPFYQVVVQWQNQGFLPTYTSQKALERQSVRPIEVILSLPSGVTLISGQLEQEIEHLEGRANKAFEKLAFGTDFRRHVEWVVKGPSGSEIEVMAVAERAGTVRCRLRLDSRQEA